MQLQTRSLKKPAHKPPIIRYGGMTFSDPNPTETRHLEAFVCEYTERKSRLLAFKKFEIAADTYDRVARWMKPDELTEAEREQGKEADRPIVYLLHPATLTQGDLSSFELPQKSILRCNTGETSDDYFSLLSSGIFVAGSKAPQELPEASMRLVAAAHRRVGGIVDPRRQKRRPTHRPNPWGA